MEKARQLPLVSILAIRPLADVLKLVTWFCHLHCHILSGIVLLGLLFMVWRSLFAATVSYELATAEGAKPDRANTRR